MKLPIISGKEVIKTLTKEGFQIKGRKGSHVTLEKTNLKLTELPCLYTESLEKAC